MRAVYLIGAMIALTGTANATPCILAEQAEKLIENAAPGDNPQVSFITPLGVDASANALDAAYAVTFRSGGYFGMIIKQDDGTCAALDGIANPLADPVQWQTARKNIRAATGLD